MEGRLLETGKHGDLECWDFQPPHVSGKKNKTTSRHEQRVSGRALHSHPQVGSSKGSGHHKRQPTGFANSMVPLPVRESPFFLGDGTWMSGRVTKWLATLSYITNPLKGIYKRVIVGVVLKGHRKEPRFFFWGGGKGSPYLDTHTHIEIEI